jgi:hypothetical protein
MTVKYTKLETLAQDIAKGFVGVIGLQATIEANRQAMVKLLKGRKLKTAKAGGAEIIRFKEELEKSGKYSEQHIKNTCTTFLKGVNENKPFSFNPYRAKGAQTAPKGASANASKSVIRLEVKGDPDPVEVASALRKFFNKMKGSDKLATLASFHLDACDEFDGE